MARDFQDIQQLDSEENDHQLGRGEGPGAGYRPKREDPVWKGTPLPQPLVLQRLCSKLRLSLLVLGFNVLMLVAVCVVGSQSEGHRDGAAMGEERRAVLGATRAMTGRG